MASRRRGGRPYTIDDGDGVLAPAVWAQSASAWGGRVSPPEGPPARCEGWTAESARAAAEAWTTHGQHEHASVASFSRFSLDLMRFAAPPVLVAAAHRAAGDEVQHAMDAFALASQFRLTSQAEDDGKVLEVGPFPIDEVELSPSLEELAAKTFQEGVLGESLAVAHAAVALREAPEASPARALLGRIVREEARHAALAWATVRWAFTQGAAPNLRLPAAQAPKGAPDPESSLTWAGKISAEKEARVGAVALAEWVAPWAAHLQQRGAAWPPEAIALEEAPALVGDEASVQEVMRLVRAALVDLETPGSSELFGDSAVHVVV